MLMSDTTCTVTKHPVYCPYCGHYSEPGAIYCVYCKEPTVPLEGVTTHQLDHLPLTLPTDHPGQECFAPAASAIVQFLPSGSVVMLELERPAILGRETGESGGADLIDLTEFNAVRHGVSRRHCQLRRRAEQLIVTDLNSTNGTYLNHRRLEPGRDTVVLHGDKLILGTLHLLITFSTFAS